MSRIESRIRFSPRELQEYVQTVDGLTIGPATYATLRESLAAWNIYWLSFPHLESYCRWRASELMLYEGMDPLLGPALQTAAQSVGDVLVTDLATYLSPKEFVIELRRRGTSHLELAKVFGGGMWLEIMESRIELAMTTRANFAPRRPELLH